VFSPAARQVREWALEVPPGSNIKQALMQSRLLHEFADLAIDTLHAGIWGKPHGLSHKLKEHDRIEIYRPLRVDPKVARRERFSRQGVKSAGLFATKRVGAKAGYGG
jgi:putative ubiquitin-RnfH superfamily antitoxin RatB of RatAB toxin-antitoxin module